MSLINMINTKKLSFLFLLLVLPVFAICQTPHKFGFGYWKEIEVFTSNEKLLNPWTGGMNNVQFGEIDLNMDGEMDLIVFEKHGSKLLPFVFIPGSQPGYEYQPDYSQYFPPINSLFQLKDYNGDSKPDIFTYTTGGIMVYRNISTDKLRFEKAVKQFVTSLQGSIFTNLLITNVDYPVIHDLDNDGDMDILTFWGLGSFMELHKNMSVETTGNADSLLFHKVDFCWGNFAESPESNSIILDTCIETRPARHTGSTLLAVDLNDDGKLDLTLGDVDFGNIQALINGGDNMDAFMISRIDSFPENHPVSLISFPSLQIIDAYNDGIKDLVASPFDPGLIRSAGSNSVWLYNMEPDGNVTFSTEAFLQDQMIDVGLGSNPVFAEISNDQLTDIVIGNFGQLRRHHYNENGQLICEYTSGLSLFRNTGSSTEPEFSMITDDFAGLLSLEKTGLYPAFHDLNDDGFTDMLLGTGDGNLYLLFGSHYDNDGIPVFDDPTQVLSGTAGLYLTPAIADINGDGLADVLMGNQSGKLTYLENTGTPNNPVFQQKTDYYGHINVTNQVTSYTGYSVPSFFRDREGALNLIVGSESGKLFYFPGLSSDYNEILNAQEDAFVWVNEGIRTSASLSDINDDGHPDMLAGNYAGGVKLFKGKTPSALIMEELNRGEDKLEIYPNPALNSATLIFPEYAEWDVTITNYQGMIVKELVVKDEMTLLQLNELRSGLYLIVASQYNGSPQKIATKLLITR